MNPYREAYNILWKLRDENVGGIAYGFLDDAAHYCWKAARQIENSQFDSQFREVSA